MLDAGCWMRDAGHRVLGTKGASPSGVVHPEDLLGHGQGAGRANGPHCVLQIPRLSHSTVGEHWEHPPTRLTRRKRGKKPNQPTQEGGEANWFDFRSAAPSWLRFAR